MTNLEERFYQEMIEIYKAAKKKCKYNATRFLNMVNDQGGVAAARTLVMSDTPSEGFTTLWLSKRLDLTVEAHVIKPEFEALFTEEERQKARERLTEYKYKFE